MKQQLKVWASVALMLMVTACGTTRGPATGGDVAVEDRGTSAAESMGAGGTETMGIQDYGSLGMEALQDPASPLSRRVIYFELDSAEIAETDREVLAAHASFLAGHPDLVVTLEGHADERGSREYNIGLGDRRAQSVRRQLEFQGVTPAQIRVVSYGEERPAVEGHDESAWSMNRRVELVYGG